MPEKVTNMPEKVINTSVNVTFMRISLDCEYRYMYEEIISYPFNDGAYREKRFDVRWIRAYTQGLETTNPQCYQH